jgi:hypothetical protein
VVAQVGQRQRDSELRRERLNRLTIHGGKRGAG